jgi:hypothetical protein
MKAKSGHRAAFEQPELAYASTAVACLSSTNDTANIRDVCATF